MPTLSFEFEWIDPAQARGVELRATWAQFRILVDDRPITRLIDGTSRSVRSHLFLPLYPVAEWLCTHWWSLLYEVESPRRLNTGDFTRRHSLRQAGEGFALPLLSIVPGGQFIRMGWSPAHLETQQLEFADEGVAHIEVNEFRAATASFVCAVVRRLEEADIQGTLLQEEWTAIANSSEDEVEFCSSAAALGFDPYVLEESQQRRILEAAQDIPESVRGEFFSVAELDELPAQTQFLGQVFQAARANTSDLSSLKTFRDLELGQGKSHVQPWDGGYQFARQLRLHLGLDGEPLASLDTLASALQIRGDDLKAAISFIDRRISVDAAIDVNVNQSPGFVVAYKHPNSVRFALCRAFYEYLARKEAGPSLITGSSSDRQKANRAFAAEFLAPAAGLERAIRGRAIGTEEIEELAERFGVSPTVIEHQAENHRLARVVS